MHHNSFIIEFLLPAMKWEMLSTCIHVLELREIIISDIRLFCFILSIIFIIAQA